MKKTLFGSFPLKLASTYSLFFSTCLLSTSGYLRYKSRNLRIFSACLLLISACLFLFSGCNREAVGPDYPITYVSGEYRIVTDVRLFSYEGEVMERDIIDKYLEQLDTWVFHRTGDTVMPPRFNNTIVYL